MTNFDQQGRRRAARRGVLRSASAAVILSLGLVGCGSDKPAQTTAALNPTVVKDGSLTVCTSFPYPPFEFKRDGEPVGFDVDLANEVAKSLDLKPVYVNGDFDDDIQSGKLLNDGTCDVAVSAMTITGERARVLDFSAPYFDATQAMVVQKDSGVQNLADLSGQAIGVQGGTTGELYVTDNAPSDAEIIPYADADEVDAALSSGEIVAGVYDNTVVSDVISRNPTFDVAEEFDTGEQYGMAVKKNGSVDLLRTINNVLADLKADKGYDKIFDKWFGTAGQL